VELEGWMIDGMVHVSTLRDDEYRFSPDRMEWSANIGNAGSGLATVYACGFAAPTPTGARSISAG